MRARPLSLVPAALALALLSGCTFSVGTPTASSIEPASVASAAADALEETTGVRPEIDCGDEEILLEKDRSVTCLLVDPVAGLEYDVVITFTDVAADGYDIDVAVAEVPNNAPEPTVTSEPQGPDAAPTVPGETIAALAIQALTPELGFVPEIRCPEENVAIVPGNVTSCSYDDEAGSHDVEVEISSLVGLDYTITARVLD